MSEPLWLALLREEVQRRGSMQLVANLVGVSRPTISLALGGKYPADTKKLEVKVLSKIAQKVDCPHLQATITLPECKFNRTRGIPTSNASARTLWFACQECPVGDSLKLPRSRHAQR